MKTTILSYIYSFIPPKQVLKKFFIMVLIGLVINYGLKILLFNTSSPGKALILGINLQSKFINTIPTTFGFFNDAVALIVIIAYLHCVPRWFSKWWLGISALYFARVLGEILEPIFTGGTYYILSLTNSGLRYLFLMGIRHSSFYWNPSDLFATLYFYPFTITFLMFIWSIFRNSRSNKNGKDQAISSGYSLLRKNNYPGAIDASNKVLESYPDDCTALALRGTAYYRMGKNNQALVDLNKAIELDPLLIEAYYWRATLFLTKLEDYPAALADFNKAIKLDSQNALVYRNRGITYSAMKDYPAALADHAKAIKFAPKDASTYFARGLTYYKIEDYHAGLADFTKAIKLVPKGTNANYYLTRAMTYKCLKEYRAALADYNKSIELDPTIAEAYANRGITYHVLKEYVAALADYNKAIDLDPQDPMSYYNLACSYALQGQVEKACDKLRSAIQMNQEYADSARTDPDFDSIRGSNEFQALLNR